MAESYFINNIALNPTLEQIIDKSGSCALFAIFLNDEVYIGNVGDSRAFLSSANGDVINSITIDHKPNEVNEMKRILTNGGKVYQARTSCRNQENNENKILLGPHRVSPGRLSVSRTFGDVEAKLSKFGGIEGVVVASPDIFKLKIREEMDFILLGCKDFN
jgi:protein phosphatase 2C family protein 2/3